MSLSKRTDLCNSISSVKIPYYSFTFSIFLDFGDIKKEKYNFHFLLFILSYKLLILTMSFLSLQYRYVSSLVVNYPITSHERPLRLQEFYTIVQSAHTSGEVVNPKHRPPLPFRRCHGTHFC